MKQSVLIKDNSSEKEICFTIFLAMVWSKSILLQFVRGVLIKIPIFANSADFIITLAFVSFFILSISTFIKELYIKEFFITFSFYGIFLLHKVLFPENARYYEWYTDTVIKEVLPMFLIGIFTFRIRREETLKLLFLISLLSVWFYVGYMILFNTMEGRILRGGDMHAAYMLLPHLCMVFYTLLQKRSVWNIGGFCIGVVCLLFLGNRGSLFCLGLFVVFTILFSGKLDRPLLFMILSAIILLALFSFGLLDFLYSFAEKKGFSLRIFEKLEKGEIASASGRDTLSERLVWYIALYPVMGMGIFGDRRVAGGVYAHNIILEIISHFGIILGVLIIITVLSLCVIGYIHLRKTESPALGFYSVLLFSFCVKLLLSGSYITEPYFFFTMGYAYAATKEWRKMRRVQRKIRGKRSTFLKR